MYKLRSIFLVFVFFLQTIVMIAAFAEDPQEDVEETQAQLATESAAAEAGRSWWDPRRFTDYAGITEFKPSEPTPSGPKEVISYGPAKRKALPPVKSVIPKKDHQIVKKKPLEKKEEKDREKKIKSIIKDADEKLAAN